MKLALRFSMFATAVIFGLSALAPFSADAVSGADFKAGRIIDDAVFTNKDSMTVAQIQQFINAKVPVCEIFHSAYNASNPPPYTCLKDYQENTTTGANNFGQFSGSTPVSIAGGKSAAQIIWEASQAYNINPQVMIVLLQKEQGLVTDTWPLRSQFTKATGYLCPDTAACNSNAGGFSKQVFGAAWQFRNDLNGIDTPGFFSVYGKGLNNIRLSPNAACGTKSVFVENQATAVLYKYTPYTPNAAALNNLSGLGDGCSAYGNRNFWRYFNEWFGSTTRDLVSVPGSGVYIIENGVKHGIPNEETFLSYSYKWSDVMPITYVEFNQIPTGVLLPYNVNFRNWQLVKTSDSTGIYLVYNGTKRGFPNEATFLSQGYKWSAVVTVSNTELSLIPTGTDMPYNPNFRNWQLVKTSDSTGIYLVYNGTKRGFPNEATFLSQGYKWSAVVTVSNTELSLIPTGTDMPYNPNFRNWQLVKTSDSTGIYLVYNGTKRGFPNEATFLSQGYKWSAVVTVSNTELSLIPTGTDMPYNPNFR